jgi:hypothetical protein
MMPGFKRQLRLVVDWTVDLVFGRDMSELGQLGHPPPLEAQSAGGTPPSGRFASEAEAPGTRPR